MSLKIQVGNLELSQFSLTDMRELYCIRNDESVRRFMSRPQIIPYKSHVRWVSTELIGNTGFLLFLVRTRPGERAVGLSQLKIRCDTAEIGMMYREPARHRAVIAVSAAAMVHLAFGYLRLKWLVSYVIPGHTAALNINKGFGAWEEESDKPDMIKLRLSDEVCMRNDTFRRIFGRIESRCRVTVES